MRHFGLLLLALALCVPVRAARHGQTLTGVSDGGGSGLAIPMPTSFWRMEEATAATRGDTAGSNNLIDNGSTPQATGRIGNAAGQYSASNFLKITSPAGITGLYNSSHLFEIGCWIKVSSTGVTQEILTYTGIALEMISPATIRFSGAVNTAWGSSLTTGTWFAVSFGYDGTHQFIVINAGTPVTSTTAGGSFSGPLIVGATPSGTQPFNGLIDAVGVWWGINLTSAQRTAWYNGIAGSGAGTEYYSGAWR